ncbi:MAG: Sua5/YciO/YrdC/YwlC family protein [Candidatus Pacebacteria bacterium]|nr:Sua5/YciO/YrdC/YwlC family protein [Candidatus Paceibacterota bacterium]
MIWNNPNLIKVLKDGGVAVMPTDTIYGIVGRAQNLATVEHIYALRKRSPNKPCIILIGNINELEKFSISLSQQQQSKLKESLFNLSGIEGSEPLSIVLDCPDDAFAFLHRGTNTLAFRVPLNEELRNLLIQTGPLIAPSANIEDMPPVQNIDEAKKYFGNSVNLYVDGGAIAGKASKVIRLNKDGTVTVVRE